MTCYYSVRPHAACNGPAAAWEFLWRPARPTWSAGWPYRSARLACWDSRPQDRSHGRKNHGPRPETTGRITWKIHEDPGKRGESLAKGYRLIVHWGDLLASWGRQHQCEGDFLGEKKAGTLLKILAPTNSYISHHRFGWWTSTCCSKIRWLSSYISNPSIRIQDAPI